MALGHILVACVIVMLNIEAAGSDHADLQRAPSASMPASGAILGLAIMWGVARRVFQRSRSGYRPARLLRRRRQPSGQAGLVQGFSVYVDTLFVCSPPLHAADHRPVQRPGPDGSALFTGIAGVAWARAVQTAMENIIWLRQHLRRRGALFFFAFTTIVAYYYIAETNIAYINRWVNRPWMTLVLKAAIIGATVYGTVKPPIWPGAWATSAWA